MVLLQVNNLKTSFETNRGLVTAVRDISFEMKKGEIVGIVGESGCGKSVMAQSIVRLLEHTDDVTYEGSILFEGSDLLKMKMKNLRKIRGNDISIIFQDPSTSLNPVYSVGNQLIEVLRLHEKLSKKEARLKAIELLRLTGIPSPEQRIDEYPHELSGGMQQRAMIALALACKPKLLIADEPTTALDVTIQAQILDLIVKLNEELNMAVLLITHDLNVVADVCQSVKVMYLGEIIEEATSEAILKNPLHPYTQGLWQSKPDLNGDKTLPLQAIQGTVPALSNIPTGCSFSTRCPFVHDKCKLQAPPMYKVSDDQYVKCWLYEQEGGLV